MSTTQFGFRDDHAIPRARTFTNFSRTKLQNWCAVIVPMPLSGGKCRGLSMFEGKHGQGRATVKTSPPPYCRDSNKYSWESSNHWAMPFSIGTSPLASGFDSSIISDFLMSPALMYCFKSLLTE